MAKSQNTLIHLEYQCGHRFQGSRDQMIYQFGSLQKARSHYRKIVCRTCAISTMHDVVSVPLNLNVDEQDYVNKAIEIAEKLNRPFSEREVLQQAWNDGHELTIAHLGERVVEYRATPTKLVYILSKTEGR